MGALATDTIVTPFKALDSNEGGVAPVDIVKYQDNCIFSCFGKSDAGTSPTLDVKLQDSNESAPNNYRFADSSNNIDVQLRIASDDSVLLAASFVQAAVGQIKSITIPLKERGTIPDGTNLSLNIQADDSGDPDDTDIGSTATVALSALTSGYIGHTFTFDPPVEVTAATFWMVLKSDYTVSATNNAAWNGETGLTSGGNQNIEDGTSWTADADDSQLFEMVQYAFVDVTGGAFAQLTATGVIEDLTINVNNLDRFIRGHVTIGGTSTPAFYTGVSIFGHKTE